MSYFLHLNADGSFGFPTVKISDSDVSVSDAVYNQFFQKAPQLPSDQDYKIKDINGTTFDDIFEIASKDLSTVPPSTDQTLADLMYQLMSQGVI